MSEYNPNSTIVTVDKFLGIRNTLRPEKQPLGALSEAVNVIIDDVGGIERRDGYSQVRTFTDITSVYSTIDGRFLFYVDDGKLIVRNQQNVETQLATLPKEKLYWAEFGDTVYYAGNTVAGMIDRGAAHKSLNFPIPSQPTVSVSSGGQLYAGQYQVSLVYKASDGRRGPASQPVVLNVAEGSRLNINVGTVPSGFTCEVYVSPPDGTEMYFIGTTSATMMISSWSESYAIPLSSEFKNGASFPFGCIALAVHEAKLFVGTYVESLDTSFIFWSRPWMPWVWRLNSDFLSLPHKVCGIVSTTEGLLIGTTKEIWLFRGDQLQLLADYGMVEGSPIARDIDGVIAFWTTRGVHTFPPFKNHFLEKLSVPPGSLCFSTLFNRHGQKYCLVLTNYEGKAFNSY